MILSSISKLTTFLSGEGTRSGTNGPRAPRSLLFYQSTSLHTQDISLASTSKYRAFLHSITTKVFFAVALVGTVMVTGCAGRTPIPVGEIPKAVAPSVEDERYGYAVYQELAKQSPISRNDAIINTVRDVVKKLSVGAGADKLPWNVYVFEDDRIKNAAATRGNFMFVWTGIMKIMRSDDELATVLGHEMGHVLAKHTMPTPQEEAREAASSAAGQITSQTLSQVGGSYGALAGIAGSLIEGAFTATLVNPEKQRMEYEADQIGIFLMAKAGFDPRQAVNFWDKASRDPDFAGPEFLQFMSTHPATNARLEKLKELLPMALKYSRG